MVIASASNTRVGQRLRVIKGSGNKLTEGSIVEVRLVVQSATTKHGTESGLVVTTPDNVEQGKLNDDVEGMTFPIVWGFERFRLLRRKNRS